MNPIDSGDGEYIGGRPLQHLERMTSGSIQRRQKTQRLAKKQKEILDQLLVSIRSAPNVTARLNRTTITCLLSSTQDKLYAEVDSRRKKFSLTYRVEQDKTDHSELVHDLFKEASQGLDCAKITTGKFYTQILLDTDFAKMNLLIRRLADKLEDEDLGNSLTNGRQNFVQLGAECDQTHFDDIAKIIHISARDNIKWPFEGSFRKALGFVSVDRLITIGHSQLALSAKPNEQWREHVVPAVMVKRKVYEMAKQHAPPRVISEFLKAHLAILIITKKEAQLMDRQITADNESLRTSMREGWDWGHDPLARIKAVGIKPHLVSNYKQHRWMGWSPSFLNSIWYWLNKPICCF